MSKNSLITLILSYQQILLSEIKKSSIILLFDPLAFELKPFYWYVTVCQWLTMVHSRLTAGLWMRTNALSPAGCWSIMSNTIFEHHFVCVHSYSHPVKNLLLQKLQYYKRGLGSTLLNMSWNARVVIAVIFVSSLSYSKSGKWLTWTKCSFFRSSIWKMRNSSEKVSFKRRVVLWKDQKYAQLNIEIWSNEKQ